MVDSASREIVCDALLSLLSVNRYEDRWREVSYEEPIRFSGEIRFAAVGVRSMVDAVVLLSP